jgi:hypothetical protein
VTPTVFYRHGQWWAQALVGDRLVTGVGSTQEEATREFKAALKRLAL